MARILLIEDDSLLRDSLGAFLEGNGHEVLGATGGAQGIERFRRSPCPIVITDIVMPDKNGLETIEELRRLAPNSRIIAISGGSSEVVAADCLELAGESGAIRLLSKPFDPSELAELVAELVTETSSDQGM